MREPAESEGATAQAPGPRTTRAGYVTLAGAPNAGKSTLLNALVGEELSIVTPKAQTTWQRVTGLYTADAAQMIVLDTPGLLDPTDLFQRSMLGAALEAVEEADVVLLVLDAAAPPAARRLGSVTSALSDVRAPIFCAINKIDLAEEKSVEVLEQWAHETLGARGYRISARTGQGVEKLRQDIHQALPESPFLYPEDDIAAAPVRFFVAEFVRQTVFEQFRQEVPYSVFCQAEEFREGEDPIYIQVNVFVERNSQKRILIGQKGSAIKRLGRVARGRIEDFLGRSVYLDLWVKVLPGWRRKRGHLARFGFRVPEDHEAQAPS